MISEQQKEIYRLAIDHFGLWKQIVKTMEECGELVQSLSKELLCEGDSDPAPVIEELADVQIMVHQMSIQFGRYEFEKKVFERTAALSKRIAIELVALQNSPQASPEKS